MRYIKISNGLTLRVPNMSIDSADAIMSRWKDNNKAFDRVSGWLGAQLEPIGDWQTSAYQGQNINHLKIKIVDFWKPEGVETLTPLPVVDE